MFEFCLLFVAFPVLAIAPALIFRACGGAL